jgi:hypothetical protein
LIGDFPKLLVVELTPCRHRSEKNRFYSQGVKIKFETMQTIEETMQTIEETLFSNRKTEEKCSKQLTKYPFNLFRKN